MIVLHLEPELEVEVDQHRLQIRVDHDVLLPLDLIRTVEDDERRWRGKWSRRGHRQPRGPFSWPFETPPSAAALLNSRSTSQCRIKQRSVFSIGLQGRLSKTEEFAIPVQTQAQDDCLSDAKAARRIGRRRLPMGKEQQYLARACQM